MVTNRHLHIRYHSDFYHLFQSIFPDSQYTVSAFQPIFFSCFAKFSLRYESQTFLDFMNDPIIFEKPASQVTLEGWKQAEFAPRMGSRLYARCTVTSMSCHSSHSWTRWAVCGHAFSWWSIHYPTSSGHYRLVCPNNFSNTDMYLFFIVFVPHSSICVLVTVIQSAYAFLASFQLWWCVSGRNRRTFIYQIIHISACISHTEVVEHLSDTSWPMEKVCFARITIGHATGLLNNNHHIHWDNLCIFNYLNGCAPNLKIKIFELRHY